MTYNSQFDTSSSNATIEKWIRLQDNEPTANVVDDAFNGSDWTLATSTTDNLSVLENDIPYLPRSLQPRHSSDGQIDSGNDFETGDDSFTIAFRQFLDSDADSGGKGFVGRRYSDGDSKSIGVGANGATFQFQISGPLGFPDNFYRLLVNAPELFDDAWHEMVFVRDGNTLRFFADGTELGSQTFSFSFSMTATNPAFWRLAGHSQFTGQQLRYRDLSLHSTAWGTTEINEWDDGPEPKNTSTPAAPTGTLQQGETLTAQSGSWDIDPVFGDGASNGAITKSTIAWWRADDASGTNAVQIAGASGSTYTPTDDDIGFHIATEERGTNDGGFDSNEDTLSAWTSEPVKSPAGPATIREGLIYYPGIRSGVINNPGVKSGSIYYPGAKQGSVK